MKTLSYLLLISLFSNSVLSQYKEPYNNQAELTRITKLLNSSGAHLEKSGKQELSAIALLVIGGGVSYFGGREGNADLMNIGIGVSAVSIPLFISSAINKRKAGEKMKDFSLLNSNVDKATEVNDVNEENASEVEIIKADLLKVGQVVYFYKGDDLIEATTTLIDSSGARVEYFDSEKGKSKSKYIFKNKIIREKP